MRLLPSAPGKKAAQQKSNKKAHAEKAAATGYVYIGEFFFCNIVVACLYGIYFNLIFKPKCLMCHFFYFVFRPAGEENHAHGKGKAGHHGKSHHGNKNKNHGGQHAEDGKAAAGGGAASTGTTTTTADGREATTGSNTAGVSATSKETTSSPAPQVSTWGGQPSYAAMLRAKAKEKEVYI